MEFLINQLLRSFFFVTLGYLGALMHSGVLPFDLYIWIRDTYYTEPMHYLEHFTGYWHEMYCEWILATEGL